MKLKTKILSLLLAIAIAIPCINFAIPTVNAETYATMEEVSQDYSSEAESSVVEEVSVEEDTSAEAETSVEEESSVAEGYRKR